jgi:hypothetical protein
VSEFSGKAERKNRKERTWKACTPGMSVTSRTSAHWPAGIPSVSRLCTLVAVSRGERSEKRKRRTNLIGLERSKVRLAAPL